MKRGHSTSKATVRTHPRTIGSKNQEMAQSIPSRFEQVVATLSDRIAVRTREYVLTYAELNAAANRMAHAILSLRGEGEEPVILLLEYNTSVFVALLGVLKTGKFYVTIAVGTVIADRPPHRSVRAELPHTVLTVDVDVQKVHVHPAIHATWLRTVSRPSSGSVSGPVAIARCSPWSVPFPPPTP
jgi:hypothetical protein